MYSTMRFFFFEFSFCASQWWSICDICSEKCLFHETSSIEMMCTLSFMVSPESESVSNVCTCIRYVSLGMRYSCHPSISIPIFDFIFSEFIFSSEYARSHLPRVVFYSTKSYILMMGLCYIFFTYCAIYITMLVPYIEIPSCTESDRCPIFSYKF